MEITKIFAKLNGNPKTLNNRDELIKEYKTYKNLNSLQLIICTKEGEVTLSLLSCLYFIITGKIQTNIIDRLEDI